MTEPIVISPDGLEAGQEALEPVLPNEVIGQQEGSGEHEYDRTIDNRARPGSRVSAPLTPEQQARLCSDPAAQGTHRAQMLCHQAR